MMAISGGLGHTCGASGVLQVIATACALTEQVVPPIVNGRRTTSESHVELVTGSAQRRPLERAAILSTGFGGTHVGVCLGRGERLEVLSDYSEERLSVSNPLSGPLLSRLEPYLFNRRRILSPVMHAKSVVTSSRRLRAVNGLGPTGWSSNENWQLCQAICLCCWAECRGSLIEEGDGYG